MDLSIYWVTLKFFGYLFNASPPKTVKFVFSSVDFCFAFSHSIFSLTFLSLYRFGKRENDIGLVVVLLYREWRFSLMACMLGCCRSCSTRCSKPGWMGHEVVERGKGEGTKPNGPKTGFSLSELSPQLPPVPLPTWCFKASSQWRTTQNGRENSCPYFDILDESSDKWVHFVQKYICKEGEKE